MALALGEALSGPFLAVYPLEHDLCHLTLYYEVWLFLIGPDLGPIW